MMRLRKTNKNMLTGSANEYEKRTALKYTADKLKDLIKYKNEEERLNMLAGWIDEFSLFSKYFDEKHIAMLREINNQKRHYWGDESKEEDD